MVTKRVHLDYVEYVEFTSRYFQLAKKYVFPYIPYKTYKEIETVMKDKPHFANPFSAVSIDTFDNGETYEIAFYFKGSDKMETKVIKLDKSSTDYVEAICEWATSGYPYDVDFVIPEDWNECCSVWNGINHPTDEDGEVVKTEVKKQEEEIMKTNFNFEFGVIKSDDYRMSPYGMAVACHNTFKAFDKTTGNIVDVGDFTFKMDGAFFKMPIAVDAIKVGDMLMVNHDPMFVIDTKDGIKVVDIVHGEQKTVMPTTNIFGFNYMTKVVSMFDNMNLFSGMTAPSAEQPFGNMMPFMMMSSMCGDGGFGFDGDMGKMMMMSMMMGGQNPFAAMMGQMAPAAPVKPE